MVIIIIIINNQRSVKIDGDNIHGHNTPKDKEKPLESVL